MPRRSLALATACLAVLCCAGGCGNGDETAYLSTSPSRIQFGRVLHGDAAKRTLVLRNGGTNPVAITSATANCACFQVHAFQRLIQPGDERSLEVTLISGAVAPGPIRGKKLKILSNDPLNAVLEIPLEGEIVTSSTLDPSVVDLGSVPDAPERIVKLRPGPGMKIRVLSWRVTQEAVLSGEAVPAEDGMDFHIRVREGASGTNPFAAALEIRLAAEGQGFPERNLEHVVRIHGEWPD